MAFFKYHDRNIYYEIKGKGEPLIFLHNGFHSSVTWEKMVSSFSGKYMVIIYDRFGYGKSTQYTGRDIGDMINTGVEELHALTGHLEIKKFSLIGHCIGGAIALVYASMYPGCVKNLVVEAAGIYCDKISLIKSKMTFIPYNELSSQLIETLKVMHGEEYSKKFWDVLSHQDNYIMKKEYDIRDDIKKIKCPVLIINGDRDFYFDVNIPAEIYSLVKKGELWILPSTGHDVHLEHPEIFNKTVREFLLRYK